MNYLVGIVLFVGILFPRDTSAEQSRARVAYAKRSPSGFTQAERVTKRPPIQTILPYFRLYAGLNFGYAAADSGSGTTSPSGSTRNAITLGFWIEQPISQAFAIEYGLAYVQRGVQTFVYQLGEMPINGTVVLNNLEIPVRLRVTAINAGRWNAYATAGLTGALTLQREVAVLDLLSINQNDRFRSADLMLNGSLGLEYRINSSTKLNAELKGDFGMVDLDNTSANFRTRGYQLLFGVGWAFQ